MKYRNFSMCSFGDMSVVGPRPHMIIHNRKFSEIMDQYHVRTFAKLGLLGSRKRMISRRSQR